MVERDAETATKIPLPKTIDCQVEIEGNVLAVQVTPSGEVAAAVPPPAIATKTPLPKQKTKLSTSIGSFEIEIWEGKAVVENLVNPFPLHHHLTKRDYEE